MQFRSLMAGATAVVLAVGAAPAMAETRVDFILNWIAGGDHAPYYYAVQEGWYGDAGIDLRIEQGKGSSMAAQRVGIGRSPVGLADLGTALVARGKGAKLVAVFNVYANSPYGMYWLKSSGIEGGGDFAGRTIGNPPWDAARAMWPAFAQMVGIESGSVEWVNVQPNAKLSALKAGAIDITTSFYNIHHIFERELGEDMGFLAWRDVGINPYGNSIIVNADYLDANRAVIDAFVDVTQNAFHFCVVNAVPCIDALVAANTGLKMDNELQNWALVVELMDTEFGRSAGLGLFEPARMAQDYELVETYFDIDAPFDIETAYTNDFIDTSVTMPVE